MIESRPSQLSLYQVNQVFEEVVLGMSYSPSCEKSNILDVQLPSFSLHSLIFFNMNGHSDLVQGPSSYHQRYSLYVAEPSTWKWETVVKMPHLITIIIIIVVFAWKGEFYWNEGKYNHSGLQNKMLKVGFSHLQWKHRSHGRWRLPWSAGLWPAL